MMCVMTDDLYERYKEALRTGHVAVLRGSREEALAAYTLAAEIAPSRALPHTSLGSVHMRLGHLQAALAEFAIAVERSPHDEGALLGQAEAFGRAVMGGRLAAARRADAGTRSARVIDSRAPEMASRTRTHRKLTVQYPVRAQVLWLGSSLAHIIGAIGPSRARRTSAM